MIYNEEFETLPREVLEALQLKRLKQVVQRVYHTVGFYRRAFDEAGVQPDDIKTLDDLKKFPFTTKQDLRDNYPFGMFAVPMSSVVRLHASSGTTGRSTVVGYTKRDIDTWSELMARCFVAAGLTKNDMHPQRLRLRPVHRRARGPLRGREAGGERHSHVRRQHETADHDPPGLRPDGDLLHPLLRPEPGGTGEGDGGRHEGPEAPGRDLRRRTLEREDAERDRKRPGDQGAEHLRPLRDHGSRGRHGMPGGAQRDACLRGPFPRGDDQSRNRRGAAAGRGGGAGLHDDHEGGLSPGPLPDEGHLPPDAGALPLRPDALPDGPGHGPERRHADHPGGQCLPLPDRGGPRGDQGAGTPLPDHRGPRRQPRHPRRSRWRSANSSSQTPTR